MIELWRPVPNFWGYEASDHWRIRSVDRITCNGRRIRGRVLRQVRPSARHKNLYVCLSVDGVKSCPRVDDLVLETWGAQQVRSFPHEAAA